MRRPFASLRASAKNADGFTLIEVMVVVVIIGILATFAVLSIGNRALDDRLDTEAKRLQQLLVLGGEEAVNKGVEIGFRYTLDGYEFLGADAKGHWAVLEDTGPFRPRKLSDPLYLDLRVEGRPVAPASLETDKEITPHILLLSSGEQTAFALEVRARRYKPHIRVEGNALGKLTLTRVEDDK